jgi:hypothetical protein
MRTAEKNLEHAKVSPATSSFGRPGGPTPTHPICGGRISPGSVGFTDAHVTHLLEPDAITR